MVPKIGLAVLADVGVDEPKLGIFIANIGFVEGKLAVSKAFDLAAVEHNPAFELFEKLVVMPSLAVFGDRFSCRGLFALRFLLPRLAWGSRFGLRFLFSRQEKRDG